MFDVVILGGGIGGLSAAAILACQGKRVCLIEQHAHLGGFAHTFKIGDYKFVAGTQYLNGCGPNGPFQRLAGLTGMGDALQFNQLDPNGFDVIAAPSFTYEIPSGMNNFRDRLVVDFPAYAAKINDYFAIAEKVYAEVRPLQRTPYARHLWREPFGFFTLLRHIRKTAQQVFDHYGFPPELQIILNGQAGNVGDGPEQASWVMLSGMQKAYCDSAAYPRRGMEHFIGMLADAVRSAPGCEIMTETRVTAISSAGRDVTGVATTRGLVHGRQYISNIDPMRTMQLLGRELKKYEYSDCVFFVHYCFKDVAVERYGFGRRNYWIHTAPRIQDEFDALLRKHDFSKPWIFVSTPSALVDPGVLCAPNRSIVTALTFLPFNEIARRAREDRPAYDAVMQELEQVFDAEISRRFKLPIERAEKIVLSPLDLLERVDVPQGNAYGPRLTPESYGVFRLSNKTRWSNLRLSGHASSFPGLMPIVANATVLCSEILGRQLSPVSARWETEDFRRSS